MTKRAHRVLLPVLTGAAACLAVPGPAVASTSLEHAVLRDINHVRARYGLGSVAEDGRLDHGARAHSRAMARHAVFGHGAWASRVERYAGTSTVGEILAYIESASRRRQARAIVSAWMHSGEHRSVILSNRFHRAGVGRAWARWNGRKTAIFTVDFAA